MHIINAMLGKGLGGIEQSFINYAHTLLAGGNKVTMLTDPGAAINGHLNKLSGIEHKTIPNLGQWDLFAVYRFKSFIESSAPDVIIAHGNRAVSLLKKAARRVCPIIGVAHNYSIKRLIGLDAVFAVTSELRDRLSSAGQPDDRIYHIPNIYEADIQPITDQPFHHPPIIGSMGRFVKKKGFIHFIMALKILDDDNVDFLAYIGGSGTEDQALRARVARLNLTEKVRFLGWIGNKRDFFRSIDIFCLPSIYEVFGIVLLEAFANGVPAVTTGIGGPSEIATNQHDALIVEQENPVQIAAALKMLIQNPKKAYHLAQNAQATLKKRYIPPVVSRKKQDVLKKIVGDYNRYNTLHKEK